MVVGPVTEWIRKGRAGDSLVQMEPCAAYSLTPTPDNLLPALLQAHRALVRATDHIRSREGHSAAYRDAARARDAAHDALVRAAPAPHA